MLLLLLDVSLHQHWSSVRARFNGSTAPGCLLTRYDTLPFLFCGDVGRPDVACLCPALQQRKCLDRCSVSNHKAALQKNQQAFACLFVLSCSCRLKCTPLQISSQKSMTTMRYADIKIWDSFAKPKREQARHLTHALIHPVCHCRRC